MCGPSASAVAGVKLQAPEALATVVPTGVPSTMTVTVLPASAVPVYVGVLSLVTEPLAGVSTTGAAGGVVSTVNVLVFDCALVLPTASVAVAFTV